jgi:holliday junction DNA helicase RuvB
MFDTFAVDSFDEYIGQTELKERLSIHIESANKRQAPMDHVLLTGPPGAGKTTISSIIADMLCVDFAEYVMPIKPNALKQIVRCHYGIVLFDEIHRCSPRQQEDLLPLIQSRYLQTDSGQILEAPDLTIIGATTEPDKVIAPLYDRFPIKPMFEPYSDSEMAKITKGMATKVGLHLTRRQLKTIGRAAGGVPRNAKSMVIMARDLRAVKGKVDTKEVLQMCNVTESGLTVYHLEYLRQLANYNPSGVEVLTSQLRLPKSFVLDLERLLVQRKMVQITKQGRELLSAGYKAIK